MTKKFAYLLLVISFGLLAVASEQTVVQTFFSKLVTVLGSLLLFLSGLLLLILVRLKSVPKALPSLNLYKNHFAFSLISIIFVFNYLSVGMRIDLYPFYSVSMFNWNGPDTVFPQTFYVEKYAFTDEETITVLDLRREASLIFMDFMPWNFGHTASFSTTFHNRSKEENLKYLERMTGRQLFVIIEKVDLATGEIIPIDGLCQYKDLQPEITYYYGHLFVPKWQEEECEN
jgi:hypothetical protein